MHFSRLQLTNFTVFEDATFDFCPGINVLIGANGTGKSHVLKAAYAVQNCCDAFSRSFNGPVKSGEDRSLNEILPSVGVHLEEVFHATASQLVREAKLIPLDNPARNGFSQNGMSFFLTTINETASFRIGISDLGMDEAPCVFIPSREFLAAYEGYIAAYTKRESAFDRTYFDLCVQLSASRLRGAAAEWGKLISEKVESELPGRVELKDGRFYIGVHQAQVVAEGHRKLATLAHLLRNGGIDAGTTLYWDEPEAGLNPRLVKLVADVLFLLADNGVQVVIATHDYLLTHELSVAVEYQATKTPVRFFCLTRDTQTAPVSIQMGETLTDLDHNPILEEFAALYDRELSLFYGVQQTITSAGGAS